MRCFRHVRSSFPRHGHYFRHEKVHFLPNFLACSFARHFLLFPPPPPHPRGKRSHFPDWSFHHLFILVRVFEERFFLFHFPPPPRHFRSPTGLVYFSTITRHKSYASFFYYATENPKLQNPLLISARKATQIVTRFRVNKSFFLFFFFMFA